MDDIGSDERILPFDGGGSVARIGVEIYAQAGSIYGSMPLSQQSANQACEDIATTCGTHPRIAELVVRKALIVGRKYVGVMTFYDYRELQFLGHQCGTAERFIPIGVRQVEATTKPLHFAEVGRENSTLGDKAEQLIVGSDEVECIGIEHERRRMPFELL